MRKSDFKPVIFGNPDSSRNDDKAVYANGRLFIMDSDFEESYSIEINLWYNLDFFEESWNIDHISYAWNVLIFDEDDMEMICRQYENIHLYSAISLCLTELHSATKDDLLNIPRAEKFYNNVLVPYAYELKDIKDLGDFANSFIVDQGELHHSHVWEFIHSIIMLPEKKKKPIDKQKGFI